MAFDIDLRNWAIDFAMQDRAEAWCRHEPHRRISWPSGGPEGLKKALLESVPRYILAYSHQTTIKTIRMYGSYFAMMEFLNGAYISDVCEKYNVTPSEVYYLKERRSLYLS